MDNTSQRRKLYEKVFRIVFVVLVAMSMFMIGMFVQQEIARQEKEILNKNSNNQELEIERLKAENKDLSDENENLSRETVTPAQTPTTTEVKYKNYILTDEVWEGDKKVTIKIPEKYTVTKEADIFPGDSMDTRINIKLQNSVLDVFLPYEIYPAVISDYVEISGTTLPGKTFRVTPANENSNYVFYTNIKDLNVNRECSLMGSENASDECSEQYVQSNQSGSVVIRCVNENDDYSECDDALRELRF